MTRRSVSMVLLAALGGAAAVFHAPLRAWFAGDAAVDAPHAHGAYYTCPMHPSVRAPAPGACPICGMPLAEVTPAQIASGAVLVDEGRRAALGIVTAKVAAAPMTLAIHAAGRVTYDETRLHDVTLKVKGWITRLDVNATGQPVTRGQRLLSLYSPELFAAQQEYVMALAHSPGLAAAAERKLLLLGLAPRQLAQLKQRGAPVEDLPIASPASGFVIEKDVVDGAAVEPGQRLYRIAALDEVWVEAAIYEADLPYVAAGQPARVTLPSGPELTGKVAAVYPYLDPASRTGKVRIALPNPELALKPEMYVDVAIDRALGPRLSVPVSAVVYTGRRRIVFVDEGGGKLRPQEVTLGARADDRVEVTAGLTAGATIVTEGDFLVAAESRIRAAAYWEDERGGR